MARTLILALGNPILSDDAAGWEIADRLRPRLHGRCDIVIEKESSASLDLIPRLGGFDRLLILDAIQLGQAPPGTLYRFTLEDFASTIRYSSAHDLNFASAFALGRQMGYAIPADIRIYAVEVVELRRFAEGCTPPVRNAIPGIADAIVRDLA
ncbi:MAG: hydrogenase 1 maturation protease [Lentisphaerae bacterium ADurb.BinA184]|mgnify:CR=1 FL=1|nr:MAG: hydrogenase 1 maturation protease [Lentisphaerae bacterium ADurb.BinA184]